jgi:nucleotide-binding universal stress UspA family protein
MKLFNQILVAVGDVDRDAELLRYARNLRDIATTASFNFVHVLGWSGPSTEGPRTHQQALEMLEEGVGEHFGGAASCHVVHGNLVDRLLEACAESAADVILVGHARDHSGRRALARRLAMKAPCSVWMRPDGSSTSIHRVLAAVDYSEPSAYALSVAGHIVRKAGGAECVALHVDASGSISDEPGDAARRKEQYRHFDRFTAPLDTAVSIRRLVEEGPEVPSAVARVALASQADLIVMGCRGQSRSASILLGSECEQVLMESTVPVLIAKRRGERIGLLQALLDRNFRLQDPPRFG